MGIYDDMLYMEHHTSSRHPRMPIGDRAAQFSPFAALTGHDRAIQETARLTETMCQLTEEEIGRLNEKLTVIQQYLGSPQQFTFTYFVPDSRKPGGSYRTCTSSVRRINPIQGILVLTNGEQLELNSICKIEGDLV